MLPAASFVVTGAWFAVSDPAMMAGEGDQEEIPALLLEWGNYFQVNTVSFGKKRAFHKKGGGLGTDCCRTVKVGQYAFNWHEC